MKVKSTIQLAQQGRATAAHNG